MHEFSKLEKEEEDEEGWGRQKGTEKESCRNDIWSVVIWTYSKYHSNFSGIHLALYY